MRIYLVGYMYCGKTTVGRRLARQLQCPFIDLDQAFEERYHLTIPLFFQKYGEEAFRQLEAQLLRQTTQEQPSAVISTGGGTPCHHNSMAHMLASGLVVWLDMPAAAILSRAATSRKPRPLMQGLDTDGRLALIEAQLAQRRPVYSQAHLRLDALAPNLGPLLAMVRQNGQAEA